MPLSFPSSPTVGQQATTGGRTYQWTGEAWQLVGSGIPGATGATGPAGPAGSGIALKGSVAAVENLPGSGNVAGDSYVVTANGNLYVWSGSTWQSVGQIVGPTGAQGSTGPQGQAGAASTVTGPTGAVGATGPAGQVGAASTVTGPTGPAGQAGAAGAASTVTGPTGAASTVTGPTGPAGASGGGSFAWASVPASSTSSGTAGDIAYDGTRLYVCTATNTWRAATLTRWDGDPYWANVSLLMHMEGSGASFADLSANAFTVTATGDATQSTTQAKFGSKSAAFTAGQIYLPSDTAFDLGAADFCIEFFAYFNSVAADQRLAGGDHRTSNTNYNWAVYTTSSGQLDLYLSSTGSFWNIAAGASIGAVSTGQWYHVAIARSGGTIRTYLGGTRGSSTSTAATLFNNTANGPFFGRSTSSNTFNGYIDAVRITKGNDRGYTSATITVPTAAFPDF